MPLIQIPEPPETRSARQTGRISQFTFNRNSALWERAIPALVFLISLAYLCLFRRFSTRDLDEGIILQAAERVLRGEIPYRDFFIFYTPGSVYLQAASFKVFGDSLLVARTGIAFVGAACSVVTYCLARRVCSRKISLFAAGMTTLVSVTYRFVVVHNWYSTLFTCLAVYAAVRLLESGQKSWAFLTGSLIASTILTEQSKGAALLAGLVVGYVILWGTTRKHAVTPSRFWAFGLGLFWPWVPTLLYFASKQSIFVMFQHWFWPLNHYTQANHVFYGHLSWPEEAREFVYTGPLWIRIWECLTLSPLIIFPILPLLGLARLAFWTRKIWNQKHISPESGYYVLLSAICSCLLFSILVVRTDITDFVYLAPLWYVILAWAFQRRASSYRSWPKLRPLLQAYIYITFGMLGFALLLSANGASIRSETRRGVVFTSTKETAIQEVQTRIPSGDELLVYPYLPLYNYLTATHSPAKLDFFQAGMNTTEQAQSIIASLQSRRTRWILFDPEFGTRIPYVWPHTAISAIANDPVADYIVRHYEICKVLPSGASLNFQLMALKTVGCGFASEVPLAARFPSSVKSL
jgi:4-amino-4-deoxy-L-arabinose transferase-like glycosyltransferase